MPAHQTPRGIRNRNPGNLRISADKWQGLAAIQPDAEFFTFSTDAFGIRALIRTLITYQDKYDLETPEQLIGRWAPPSENNTVAYVAHVAQALGVEPHHPIDMHRYDTARIVAETIIRHETGVMPYDDATMRKALLLAGIEVPIKPVSESTTLKAGTVAAGATILSPALGQVADLVQSIEPLTPIVQQVVSYGPRVLAVVALAAILFMAYRYLRDRKLRVA